MRLYLIDASGKGNNCVLNALHGVVGAEAMQRAVSVSPPRNSSRHGNSSSSRGSGSGRFAYKNYRALIAAEIRRDPSALENQWRLFRMIMAADGVDEAAEAITTGYPEILQLHDWRRVVAGATDRIANHNVMLSEVEIPIAVRIAEQAAAAMPAHGTKIFVLTHYHLTYDAASLTRFLREQLRGQSQRRIGRDDRLAAVVKIGEHYYFLQRDNGSAWFGPGEIDDLTVVTEHNKAVHTAAGAAAGSRSSSGSASASRQSIDPDDDALMMKWQIEEIEKMNNEMAALDVQREEERALRERESNRRAALRFESTGRLGGAGGRLSGRGDDELGIVLISRRNGAATLRNSAATSSSHQRSRSVRSVSPRRTTRRTTRRRRGAG